MNIDYNDIEEKLEFCGRLMKLRMGIKLPER